ncbi:MAG: hypothetical protein FJ028_04355 [Chloroflexi bacterium]|nr:hypothetical protein [Chloroflexota bacterium]
MKITTAKAPLAGAALAAAFLGGVAFAPGLVSGAAAQIGGANAPANVQHPGRGGDLFQAAADFIGISVDRLRSEMGSDKSMADVAVAHGKTRDALIAALATARSARIAELVDQKGFPRKPAMPGKRVEVHIKVEAIQTASAYLGLSLGELRTRLRSGKSLADIAVSAGKTKDGLIQAIVAAETAQVDKAVADGKLTADQATRLKTGMTERAANMVEHTGMGPGFGLGRGPRGGRP